MSSDTKLTQAVMDYPRVFGWETETDHSSLHESFQGNYNYIIGNVLKVCSYFPLLGIITGIYRICCVRKDLHATDSDIAWHTFRGILECLPIISTSLLIVDIAVHILRKRELAKEEETSLLRV